MSTSFYDKVLTKLETFYKPSSQNNKNKNQMPQEIGQSSLKESNQFKRSNNTLKEDNRSNSTNQVSKYNRMNIVGSSNHHNDDPNDNPIRHSVSIPDKQKEIDQLEELLYEEKTKNSSYLNEIYHLNQRIEELEYNFKEMNRTKSNIPNNHRDLTYSYDYSLSKNYNQNINQSPSSYENINTNINSNSSSSPNTKGIDQKEYDKLLKENEELRKFKEEVYAISKEYDNINENVIVSLQEMDKLFTKINEAKYNMTYTKKAQELAKAQASFENVINTIIEMMKGKQDEYNFLVKEREKEVSDLKEEIKTFTNKVNALEEKAKELKESKQRIEHRCSHHHCHECQICIQCSHHFCECESPIELDYMKKRMR